MIKLATTGGRDILLGLDVQEGLGKYHKTKIVKVGPRFILRNNLDQDISFGQSGVLTPRTLKSNQIMPLLKLLTSPEHDDYHLCVRYTSMLSAWSNPFSLTQIGNIGLKIGKIGSLTEELIRVDISIEGATIFITFSKEEGRWPFRIENHTDVEVNYFQNGSSKQFSIVPGEEQLYAWDFPSFLNKTFVIEVNGRKRELEFSELGSQMPFKYPTSSSRAVMALEVISEGPTIVLKMKPYDSKASNFQATRGNDEFQTKDETAEVISKIRIRIEGIGISVISSEMKEILYASATSLLVAISETANETLNNFQLQWFQVDNQLTGASNPIFVYPTVLEQNRKDKDEEKPVLFASYCVSKDKSLGVDYYQWLTVLLQELSVDLDEEFLRALIEFTQFKSYQTIEPTEACDTARTPTFPSLTNNTDKLYFERFLLQPVQVNMSFTQTGKKKEDKK